MVIATSSPKKTIYTMLGCEHAYIYIYTVGTNCALRGAEGEYS